MNISVRPQTNYVHNIRGQFAPFLLQYTENGRLDFRL